MKHPSHLLVLLQVADIALVAASRTSLSSNATSFSWSNVSDTAPLITTSSSKAQSQILLNSTHPQNRSLSPSTNSRGEYITTLLVTPAWLNITLPPSSRLTLCYGNSTSTILIGPTTFAGNDIAYPEPVITNDRPVTSSNVTVTNIWDRQRVDPFLDPVHSYSGGDSSLSAAISSFIDFGRDPACTTAFSSYVSSITGMTTSTTGYIGYGILPNGRLVSEIYYTTETLPAASVEKGRDHCCGPCSLYYTDLQMFYWPESHPNNACLKDPRFGATSIYSGLIRRDQQGATAARNVSAHATDTDGNIYTSPSIYVKFPTISAHDRCGPVGPVSLTSIILSFLPGELSTIEGAPLTTSPCMSVHLTAEGEIPISYHQNATTALNLADLPCGPWNGTNHFLPNPNNLFSYQPFIALPSKLIDQYPAWSTCIANVWQGQDPPRALTAGSILAPTTKKVNAEPQMTPATPSPSIPPLPLETIPQVDPGSRPFPGPFNPKSTDAVHNADSPGNTNDPITGHPSSPQSPIIGQASLNDPAISITAQASVGSVMPDSRSIRSSSSDPPPKDPSSEKNTPALAPAVVVQGQTIKDGAAPVTINNTPVAYQAGTLSAGGAVRRISASWGQSGPNYSPVIVGGLTFSPDSTPASGVRSPYPAPIITVGSHAIEVASNAIAVAGTTLKPGDPAISIEGTPISLGSSFAVFGSRTEMLVPWLSEAATTAPEPYVTTVGGKAITVTPNANAIVMDATALHPTDPATTIDGIYVSVGHSVLIVGSDTLSLPLFEPTMTVAPSYITIGSKIITVAGKSVILDGTTIQPLNPGVTVDGTRIFLGSSVLVDGAHAMSSSLLDPAIRTAEGIGAMIFQGYAAAEKTSASAPTPAQIAKGGGSWVGVGNDNRTGNRTLVSVGGASRGVKGLLLGRYSVLALALGVFGLWWSD